MTPRVCIECGTPLGLRWSPRCDPCRHRRRNRQTQTCRRIRADRAREGRQATVTPAQVARTIEARYQAALACLRQAGHSRLTPEAIYAQRGDWGARWAPADDGDIQWTEPKATPPKPRRKP